MEQVRKKNRKLIIEKLKLPNYIYFLNKFFIALVKVGKNNDRVCGLDGDMKNSTFSQELRKIFPERYL